MMSIVTKTFDTATSFSTLYIIILIVQQNYFLVYLIKFLDISAKPFFLCVYIYFFFLSVQYIYKSSILFIYIIIYYYNNISYNNIFCTLRSILYTEKNFRLKMNQEILIRILIILKNFIRFNHKFSDGSISFYQNFN